MRTRIQSVVLTCAASMLAAFVAQAPAVAGVTPIDNSITYQGQLSTGSGPVTGIVSLRFRLFTLAAGGAQVGATLTACNVAVTDGLFTVDLDFGAAAFEGSQRFLEIGVQSPAGNCATFTTLTPRQTITAAPYAIRSLAPWVTNGTSIFYNDGAVGIGTNLPAADLEISRANATMRLTSTAFLGTSTLDLKGDSVGLSSNVLGTIRFLDDTNTVRAEISSATGLLQNPLNFSVDGTTEMVLTGNGNLGVGTTLPVAKLQLVGGSDSEPGSGGYLVVGATNSTNISIDNNEIMARNNGEVATLFLNNDGGDVSICPGANGQVGIGTAPSSSQLTVFNSLFVNGGAQPRIDVGPNGFLLMDSGADVILTNGGLEVNTPSGGSTFFNRTASDGSLISFINNGVNAGGIAVFGSTVSYNTFTGSHYGWTDVPIEHGALVSLSGTNQRDHDGPNCELVYGIKTTMVANDPRVLGAYLSAPDPTDAASRHFIAAVGNGEMWVVDTGAGDIGSGAYLISSNTPGCAMQDDPAQFAVGHVVARAGEDVKWSSVRPGADGVKRVLLSVFFESFERQGDAAALGETIDSLKAENEALRARLDAIEARLSALAIHAVAPVQASGGQR